MLSRALTTAAMALFVASCSWSSSQPTSGPDRDRNRISPEEIQQVNATTARDIIRQLRPSWLRDRGPISIRSGSPEYPVVYVDQVRREDPTVLDLISSQIVVEIRYLSGADATTQFGLDHGGGAILIRTGR